MKLFFHFFFTGHRLISHCILIQFLPSPVDFRKIRNAYKKLSGNNCTEHQIKNINLFKALTDCINQNRHQNKKSYPHHIKRTVTQYSLVFKAEENINSAVAFLKDINVCQCTHRKHKKQSWHDFFYFFAKHFPNHERPEKKDSCKIEQGSTNIGKRTLGCSNKSKFLWTSRNNICWKQNSS